MGLGEPEACGDQNATASRDKGDKAETVLARTWRPGSKAKGSDLRR